ALSADRLRLALGPGGDIGRGGHEMDAGLAVILPDDLGAEAVELVEHQQEVVAALGLGVEAQPRAAGRQIDDQALAALAADLDGGRPQHGLALMAPALLDPLAEAADLGNQVL